jgi:hypothetical protein
MRRVGLAVALLLIASSAWAFDLVSPGQHGSLANTETTSAANQPTVVTITGVAFKQAHLYQIAARCVGGTASVTVTNGGTMIFSTDTGFVGTTTKIIPFPVPLTGSINSTMVVTLGYCATNGILDLQADIY